jgi:hypothetical protein
MLDWLGLPETVGWWLLIGSAAMLGIAVFAVPVLVARIPSDYFCRREGVTEKRGRSWRWVHWLWRIVKNLLGVGCLFFGALMLVLPGQGVLTILLGVTLLDFPGKLRLQRWIVARRGVLDSLNWIRAKAGAPPLRLEP